MSGRLPFEDSDRLAVHPETRREVNIATDANGYTPGTTAWSAYTGNTAGLTLAAEVLLWNGKPEDCPSQEALDNGPLGYVDPAYLCGTGAAGSITPCNDPQHPIDVAVKADLRAQFSLGRNVGYTGLLLDGLTPEWVYPSEDRADLHRSISYRLQGLDCRLLVALADNSITELFARHAFNLRHVGSCNADIPELNMSAYTAKAGKNSPSPLGRWEGPRGKNIDPPVVMGQHWCQPEHQRWAGILAGDMSAWRWWQGWLERERNRTIVKDYGGRGASTALQTYVEAYESTGEESFRLKMKTLLGRITSVPATEQVAKLGTSPLWRPNAVTLAYFALYGRNWEKNPDWDAVEWARVMRWLDEAARQTSVGVLPLTASVTGFLGYDYISEELAHFPTTLHGPGDKWQGYGPVPTQRLIDQWPHAKWRYPHIKPRTKYRSYPCTPANFASRSGKVSLRLIIWHDGGPLEFWLRATQMARGDIHATSFVLRGLEGEKEIPLPEDVAQVFTRWGGRNPSTRLSVDLPAGTYSLEVRSHQVALQAPVCPKARCEIAVLEPGVSYQCAPTRGLLESSEQTKLTATTGSKDRPHAINGEQMMGFAGKRQLNVPVGTSRLNITGAEYSYVSFSLPAQAFLRVVPQ